MTAAALKRLRESAVFTRALPARVVYSHAQWAMIDGPAQRMPTQIGIEAIGHVPEWKEIVALVRDLTGYAAATPTLIELWQRCPIPPIRDAAGHALLRAESDEARSVLIASIDDATSALSVALGVRALISTMPTTAYARSEAFFDDSRVRSPGGAIVPQAILSFFSPISFRREGPVWIEPNAPAWLDADWLALCARLREHDLLGEQARTVLRYAAAEAVARAFADSPLPPRPPPVSKARGDLVSRYQNGDFIRVWNDVRAYAAVDGDLRDETLAVARATMRRVQANVALVSARLAEHGWRALTGELHPLPAADDAEVMTAIEEITGGPIPPSLRAFWEEVGGVDFVWNYDLGDEPDLGVDLDDTDALCVGTARSSRYLLDEWRDEEHTHPALRGPYRLDLAPDALHKANVSGGPPYGVELPYWGADPIWMNEVHALPFVDYLRLCFRAAGFPRPERGADPNVEAFVQKFGADLLPF